MCIRDSTHAHTHRLPWSWGQLCSILCPCGCRRWRCATQGRSPSWSLPECCTHWPPASSSLWWSPLDSWWHRGSLAPGVWGEVEWMCTEDVKVLEWHEELYCTCTCMWQSQVENECYSILNLISSPNSILWLLRPKVGIPLADRYELLNIHVWAFLEAYWLSYNSANSKKVVKKW